MLQIKSYSMGYLVDREYEQKINALIPAAELEAKKMVRKLGMEYEIRSRPVVSKSGHTVYERHKWSFETEFYFAAMDRMAREAGLRGPARRSR